MTASKTIAAVSFVALCYGIVNLLFVLLQYIPGMVTFVSWGLVLPAVFSFGTWVVLLRQRRSVARWWAAGLCATAAYAAMGLLSLYLISAMWAAV